MHDIGVAAEIETPRLRLTAIREADAEEMAVVLGDERLHEHIGGRPLGVTELRGQYRQWLAGSGKPDEIWLNWVVRLRQIGAAIGTMQATVTGVASGTAGIAAAARAVGGGLAAEVAWVIGVPWQGCGYAAESARALVAWLVAAGIGDVTACIHPWHRGSELVAERAGFTLTTAMVDGERVWRYQPEG
jgi:RimJ/RimL family protein N-acetyltransferase